METNKDPILELQDVSVHYRSQRGLVRAVSAVSFSVAQGQSLALIGESGCGKSSLAASIAGILPLNAFTAGGKILYLKEDGQKVNLLTLKRKAARTLLWSEIVMMLQASMSSFSPVRKIRSHFLDTAKAHGGFSSRKAVLQKSAELLDLVLLDGEKVLASYPHELSGGMKQRTLLALALLLEPRLVILDEPTTALDLLTQEKIIEILNKLRRDQKFSLIFVTHDLGIVGDLADQVVLMYAGAAVEKAPVARFFRQPRHPYGDGLLKASPRLGTEPEPPCSIKGAPPDLTGEIKGCLFAPRCPRVQKECRKDRPYPAKDGGNFVACYYPGRAS